MADKPASSKWAWFWAAVALLAVGGYAALDWFGQPTYEGERLGVWLPRLGSDSVETRAKAAEAVAATATAGPGWVAWMNDADKAIPDLVQRVLGEPDDAVRDQARTALAQVMASARTRSNRSAYDNALKVLEGAYKDGRGPIKANATAALARLTPPELPESFRPMMLGGLTNPDPEVRRAAAVALTAYRDWPERHVPALVKGLAQPEGGAHVVAILGRQPTAVPALVEALKADDATTPLLASQALVALNAEAALQEAAKSEHAGQKRWAEQGLARLKK